MQSFATRARAALLAPVVALILAGSAHAMPPVPIDDGGGGGGGTVAPGFSVHVITLYCLATEDWTGADEPYLTFNGVRRWGYGFNDETRNMSIYASESVGVQRTWWAQGVATVRLFDADSGLFDTDDLLGTVRIDASQINQGLQVAHLTGDGSDYYLAYDVLPG